jgi:hypothetical protein
MYICTSKAYLEGDGQESLVAALAKAYGEPAWMSVQDVEGGNFWDSSVFCLNGPLRIWLYSTPYYMRDLKDVQMGRVEYEHLQYWKEGREPSCHAEHVWCAEGKKM